MLGVYDLLVLGLSNTLVWRCPTTQILEFYNQHISTNHLDVGVGTGYFLDKCRFPAVPESLGLVDLNRNSLNVASRRLARYHPNMYQENVMQPLDLPSIKYDSIALSYLLHCLPGNIGSKEAVFQNLIPLLNTGKGALFGTTILGKGVRHNQIASLLMRIYNNKGIFSNYDDDIGDLKVALAKNFDSYSTKVVGSVAFFVGYLHP